MATGLSSGECTLFDERTGQIRMQWRAHEAGVLKVLAYDDNTVLTSGGDKFICVWDVRCVCVSLCECFSFCAEARRLRCCSALLVQMQCAASSHIDRISCALLAAKSALDRSNQRVQRRAS